MKGGALLPSVAPASWNHRERRRKTPFEGWTGPLPERPGPSPRGPRRRSRARPHANGRTRPRGRRGLPVDLRLSLLARSTSRAARNPVTPSRRAILATSSTVARRERAASTRTDTERVTCFMGRSLACGGPGTPVPSGDTADESGLPYAHAGRQRKTAPKKGRDETHETPYAHAGDSRGEGRYLAEARGNPVLLLPREGRSSAVRNGRRTGGASPLARGRNDEKPIRAPLGRQRETPKSGSRPCKHWSERVGRA